MSLISQVLIRISVQFGDFSEQHRENLNQIPLEIVQVFVGNASNFVSTDVTISRKQIVYVYQCGKQIRKTGIFQRTIFALKLLKNTMFITFRV